MLSGGTSLFRLAFDFGALVALTTVMVLIAGRLYPNGGTSRSSAQTERSPDLTVTSLTAR